MTAVDYSGNVIEWSDDEYDRLTAIKAKKMGCDMWGYGDELIGARITPLLKERVIEYAKRKDVNVSELMRSMLKVLVE